MNLTSGGIDNGARPICDAHGCDEEKGRVAIEGTRKVGIEVVDEEVEFIACRRQLVLVVESIARVNLLLEMHCR